MAVGRVVVERFESAVLQGNPLGDPHLRRVPVYLPPSYDEQIGKRYPVIYVLTGFTGRGRMLLNDNPWSESLDDRLNRLIGSGACGEVIVVMPDCFTRYGGSQYLNSTATGRYQDHLVQELVPYVDARYRTLPGRDHRGVVGKSSGGYGALVLGLQHPEVFGAVASHSGDVVFDYCYRGDIPKFCGEVQRGGGLARWLQSFESKVQKKTEDLHVLNILAMAACYSPNPATKPLGVDFPIDLETGAWRQDVWERWLDQDPMRLLERHPMALRSMKCVYLDAGVRDEWSLHLGARLFSARLKQHRVEHELQEFDDGHKNVSYRYDVSLPKLAGALA